MNTSPNGPKPVLVAVDGSVESDAALRWAADYAEDHGLPLRVITASRHPDVPSDSAGAYWDTYQEAQNWARVKAAESIRRTLGRTDIDHVVELGSIDTVLIEASDNAAMIVVGTRNSGGFWAKFRGSLTNRITGKVACPVISISASSAAPETALTGSGV